MKASELRIGNLVLVSGLEYSVEAIDKEGGFGQVLNPKLEPDYTKGITPIPLTEEWLVKFGFANSKTQDKFFTKDNTVGISTADDKFRFIKGNFVCQLVLRDLKYVHELQNLYFALTGEELTIK